MLRVFLLALMIGTTTVHAQSVITVTTTADEFGENEETCSLREAVQTANTQASFGGCHWNGAPVTIEIPAGTYELTRVGAGEEANATGDLDLLNDMVIVGAGAEETVIDGLEEDRVIQVDQGVEVEIVGLAIAHGRTPDGTADTPNAAPGGGIYNAGTLHLENCIVSGNATGDGEPSPSGGDGGNGGAIYNAVTGALTVIDCQILENSTGRGGDEFPHPGGDGGDGGGVYNAGTVTVQMSRIAGNTTGRQGWGFDTPGIAGRGGGLFNRANASITDTEVVGNVTDSHFDSRTAAGGGVASVAGELIIERSTLSVNLAFGAGGGLSVEGGSLEASNITISNNFARMQGGGFAVMGTASAALDNVTMVLNRIEPFPPAADGGGIWVQSEVASAYVRNSIIAQNIDHTGIGGQAPSDCGGPLTSAGFNLIGNRIGCAEHLHPTDQSGTWTPDEDDRLDPLLLPLGDYGGPTRTQKPQQESPAIDAGSCVDIAGHPILIDQRGFERPFGSTCDVGAVEWRDVISSEPTLPHHLDLDIRVYPNPTRTGRVKVSLSLADDAVVEMTLFDLIGRQLATTVIGDMAAGEHDVQLRLPIASGVYLLRVSDGRRTVVRKISILP